MCQFMEVVGVARNTYHALQNCVSILSFSGDVSSLMQNGWKPLPC